MSLHVCLFIVFCMVAINASSQVLSFTTNTLESGNSLSQGAVYRFKNVTSSGNIDALVTVVALNNLQLKSIDTAFTGTADGFQPMVSSINGAGDHYALFNITFVVGGSTIQTSLSNFQGTFFDLNGSNQINEYASIDMANATWQYANGSPAITVSQNGNTILGTSANTSLSQSVDTANKSNSFIVSNSMASSFNVKFGFDQSSHGWSGNDQFSLLFKGIPTPVGGILPIQLEAFAAYLTNEKVQLTWSTSHEVNFSHFVVERSLDGKSFSEISLVFAFEGNTAGVRNYMYNDVAGSINGTALYRLRMVDMDGKYSYSPVKTVSMRSNKSKVLAINVYPNPVTNELRVSLPEAWQGTGVTVTVRNINSQVMIQQSLRNASQTEAIDVQSLTPGIYVVTAQSGAQVLSNRIVKNN